MEEAELKRGDEFNPCMPILGAVGDRHVGDDRVLALSQELAGLLFSLGSGEDAEAQRLLGFTIAAVCKIDGVAGTLPVVSFYLGMTSFMYGMMAETVSGGGTIGAMAKEYRDCLVADRVGFFKLCTRAGSPLVPFVAVRELGRLSSVTRRTFCEEAEWREIRARIETVAPYMMPVFDWAAGKELSAQE